MGDTILCDMSATLKDLKTQFLEYLEIEKGRSVKTVENYDRYLTRFLNFAKVVNPGDVTETMVREFRITLNRSSGVSGTMKKNTQNYHLIALRAFLKFLRKRDVESLNPERIELAKTGGRDLDLISSAELDRLMNGPKVKRSPHYEIKPSSNFSSRPGCVFLNYAASIKTSIFLAMSSRCAAKVRRCE